MRITEGISGFWHYHLSNEGDIGRALCGAVVMPTGMKLKDWGVKFGEHFPKCPTWCKECERHKP